MKNNFTIIILLLCPVILSAQFLDSFDDGNFHADPAWTGDQNSFKINTSLQLQLNETTEGEAHLTSLIEVSQNMEWQFWIKLGFSPSDNNHCKIYLISDNQDLTANLNGYFLRFGESGSGDAIELFRQSGSQIFSICRGPAASIASSFSLRIKVIHDSTGCWTLFADPSGGVEFVIQDTAMDMQQLSGNILGLYCKYTGSNAGKFYFDDFYAGDIQRDIVPPFLNSVTALNAITLKLKFSEALYSQGLSDPMHYSVDKGIGQPIAVERDPWDHSLILMAFSKAFKEDSTYSITVSGLEDLQGNFMIPAINDFVWHTPHLYDILIHEIMADPDPAIGLPPYEYIELFNRTLYDCDLTGWWIQTGETQKELPALIMPPGSFALICDDNARDALEEFGPLLEISSLSLSNPGTQLLLLSADKKLIHAISYDQRWYKDDFKENGGWALELIDSGNPCGGSGNWTSSTDMEGGTPGRPNSVAGMHSDLSPPVVSKVGMPDRSHIILNFTESIDSAVLLNPASYRMDLTIESAESIDQTYKEVLLTLKQEIPAGQAFDLELGNAFCDCLGNCIEAGSTLRIAFPLIAGEQDIVINEVLFNPAPDCVDFIEIYNRSGKVVDLKQFTICGYDSVSGGFLDVTQVQASSTLFFPGEYRVLTNDSSILKHCFPQAESKAVIEVSTLPAMSNEGADIALALLNGTIIDRVAIKEDFQYPLLGSFDGVSLERINPDRPSRDKTNWHSAAESAGFATPTLQNSQFLQMPELSGEIQLSPEIFSPDNDGFNDNMLISYQFPEAGFNATITIFNSEGIAVRSLVTNELCGTTGIWSWDGIDDRNQKAAIGRYIVFVQIFDLQGRIRHFKKSAVLGGYL